MASPNDGLHLPPPWISPAAGKLDREVQPVITVQRRRPPARGPASLLLLNGSSSPIVDTSAYGWTVTASGSPPPSISTSGEFAPSINFPNTLGSYLTVPSDPLFAFRTGDFTVETLLLQETFNGFSTLLEIGNHLASTGIIFIAGTSGAVIYSGAFFGAGAVSLNTINHIAYVRQSGVLSIYVNGPRTSSVSFANDLTATGPITIGSSNPASGAGYGNSYSMAGKMRLRVTPSALYSGASLTVPTAF